MTSNKILTIKEYIRRRAYGIGSGTVEMPISPNTRAKENVFINDPNDIQKLQLEENNVWYAGEGSNILNFYTRAEFIDFNYDPIFNRNKKDYFWASSASEGDYKRTHSGVPRVMVDTMSAIMYVPHVTVLDKKRGKRLKTILEENNYDDLLMKEARPMTLVEGWGAWKINWNEEISDTPILLYYRADAVDFIYRNKRLVAIVYQDYYTDEDEKKYVLFETRRLERREIADPNTGIRAKKICLVIEKELFQYLNDQTDRISKVPLTTLPELKDAEPCLVIENCPYFLGAPSIFFSDSTDNSPGRSIFAGKIDLFDDLDLALSQGANSVKLSTPIEYIDSQYLQRDEKTGQPIQPKSFDRKFIMYKSVLGGDGATGRQPVLVTQPTINFTQYSEQAIQTVINILNGYMSPATIGLEVTKDANALSQREKEKVTIFTRNGMINTEKKTQTKIMIQLLIADQLMHSTENYNAITRFEDEDDWGISLQYDEFADASFESKIETILTAWQGGLISDNMAVDYLYKDAPQDIKDRELNFMKEQREQEKQLAGRGDGGGSDEELAALGKALGGNNNNPENAPGVNDVPNLTDYKDANDRRDAIKQDGE